MKIQQIDQYRWRIPREGQMRVDGIVYADAAMIEDIRADQSLQQVVNVAHLPGIVGWSLAMPDIHWGYGFPIGGVAAMDAEEGVVSPGGVGYDINCGVRLVATKLRAEEIGTRIPEIVRALFSRIPTGVGSGGAIPKLGASELRSILAKGSRWAVDEGYGQASDLEHTE